MNEVEIRYFESEEERRKFWEEEVGPPPNLKKLLDKKCKFCSNVEFGCQYVINKSHKDGDVTVIDDFRITSINVEVNEI